MRQKYVLYLQRGTENAASKYTQKTGDRQMEKRERTESAGAVKVWQTRSVKHKVASLLIFDKVPFRFSEGDGIVFEATAAYVENLTYRLMAVHGVKARPVITEDSSLILKI